MTITLSPEVEADIRELLRLWGCDGAGDPVYMEAVALGALQKGITDMIELEHEIAALRARLRPTVPQVVPDARVFEEADAKRAVAKAQQRREFEEPLSQSPVIPDGTVVHTTGGKRLEWRGGRWEPVADYKTSSAGWPKEGGAQ